MEQGQLSAEQVEQQQMTKDVGEGKNHATDKQLFSFSDKPNLEQIRQMLAEFVQRRGWDQFHTPRNLLLALVGEVGELAECFQWKGEVAEGLPDWSEKERQHLGEELSDVLVYLVHLAYRCHVDLPSAVVRKMDLNALKYPAEEVYGSSKKYTEYRKKDGANDES